MSSCLFCGRPVKEHGPDPCEAFVKNTAMTLYVVGEARMYKIAWHDGQFALKGVMAVWPSSIFGHAPATLEWWPVEKVLALALASAEQMRNLAKQMEKERETLLRCVPGLKLS